MDRLRYLFTPFKIGSMTVPNRIVFNAHGHRLGPSLAPPNETLIDYYAARAKGGVGLIVASYHVPFPYTTVDSYVSTQDDNAVPAFALLAKAIHEHGSKVIAQFHHIGKHASPQAFGGAAFASSPIEAPPLPLCPLPSEVPHEMDVAEIKRTVEAYGSAAYRMREAGYDGVEIGVVMGLLLASFMSPASNQRSDEYGGSLENRLRIILEVMDAVRTAVGSDFVVGVRIDGDEYIDGGLTLDDTKVISSKLEATGKLDYLNIGAGAFPTPHIPPMYFPLGPFVYLAAGIKEVVNLPVFCGGRINDPIQAEQILSNNQADMIGMTRALIADPELPNKAREGRLDDIRKCIACNDACVGGLFEPMVPLRCAINSEAGREKAWAIKLAAKKKKVMVIGGGAAGLETARVAALRGHEVSLYEKENELGGQLNIAVKIPGRLDLAEVPRYYTFQMKSLGVEVRLGTTVTVQMIKDEKPDAVVVATGSLPAIPKSLKVGNANVVEVREVLQEKVEWGNNVVVVAGEHHMQALGVADFLADKGAKVEVLTEAIFAGSHLDAITLEAIYQRLLSKGVVITPLTRVKEIVGDIVATVNVLTDAERQIKGVDTVVIATAGSADDSLYHSLRGEVKELYLVGACLSPRRLRNSIEDGARVGRLL